MENDLCCVSVEIFSFLQKRNMVSYSEIQFSGFAYLSPLTAKGLATAHVDESFESICVRCFPFPGSTQPVAAVSVERDVGFLRLQRQGLSPTGRDLVGLVYICSTVGLDICLSYGWHNDRRSLPPSAALSV